MSWQQILAQGFATVDDLLHFLELPLDIASKEAARQFAVRVPRSFAAKMQKGNPFDPLLLQILPVEKELNIIQGFSQDPLHEKEQVAIPGLLHKYYGRVLLTIAGACVINCRYCFRRHFPYQENNLGTKAWSNAIAYIKRHDDIHEVILSGGEPMLLKDGSLLKFIQQIEAIPHVKTLRIHSRMLIVLPERITNVLLEYFKNTRLRVVIVVHVNHPHELDDTTLYYSELLQQAGCTLLNQSVLLAGVNDSVEILSALSHKLLDCKILPYYLHLLDKVDGAGHFDIPLSQAQTLFRGLQEKLPGYLVPRLVREQAGFRHKTLVSIDNLDL